jgi:hypothetical protein
VGQKCTSAGFRRLGCASHVFINVALKKASSSATSKPRPHWGKVESGFGNAKRTPLKGLFAIWSGARHSPAFWYAIKAASEG